MLEMGFFSEISIRNNYPWKYIRKSGSKIWRKVLRKNCAIYSVQRAFLREDNFRESKYTRLKIEENKEVETMKNYIGKETGDSSEITIDNTVGQDSTMVTENIVVDSNRTVDNSITSNIHEKGDFATTSPTQCDTNSTDSISMGGVRVIVEVQLETSNMSNDQQEICSEKELERHQPKRIPDEKISQSEISRESIDRKGKEILVYTKKSEDNSPENDECSFGDQVETKMLNESVLKDSNINCNSEKVMTTKNEFKKEPSSKTEDETLEKTENEMISKFSPSHPRENKENKTDIQYETPIKAKIRIFQNKHTQLGDCNITENEKYKDSGKETDCSIIESNLTGKLSNLVKLYEEQAIPSPMYKMTSAKIHPCHPSKHKMDEDKNETVGPEECDIISITVSSLDRTKQKNPCKDLVDDFSSVNQQKCNSDTQSQVQVRTPQREADSILREKNTVEDIEMQNIPAGFAEATKYHDKRCHDETEGSADSTSDEKSVSQEVQLEDVEIKRIGLSKDEDLNESSSCNRQLEASRENISFNSISDFIGLVETRVDSSFNSDSFSSNSRHRNISSSSFYDLNGLTETRVNSSTNSGSMEIGNTTTESTNVDSGRYTPSRNESYETSTGQSDEMDEITIEIATLDRSRTRRDAKGRIPSIKMNKFETLFRKSSLKKLYKMMEKSHKKSRVLETPLDDLTQAKFVLNCYGPSIRKKEICKWPLCST